MQRELERQPFIPPTLPMEQCQALHLSDVGLACQANVKQHQTEQCQNELLTFAQHLSALHLAIFKQVQTCLNIVVPGDVPATRPKQQRPGDWVYVKVHKRKWDKSRREGLFKITLLTPTALKFRGKDVWFHLTHCTPAPEPTRT